jgi:hypothetical protein
MTLNNIEKTSVVLNFKGSRSTMVTNGNSASPRTSNLVRLETSNATQSARMRAEIRQTARYDVAEMTVRQSLVLSVSWTGNSRMGTHVTMRSRLWRVRLRHRGTANEHRHIHPSLSRPDMRPEDL